MARSKQRSPDITKARRDLMKRVGVIADPNCVVVRCMRCGERWCPVLVLVGRGYRLPTQWWRCPHDCNRPGTEPFDWTSDFTKPWPETPAELQPMGTYEQLTDAFRGKPGSSGEVLSFDVLMLDENA